jgi:hypothetical protein
MKCHGTCCFRHHLPEFASQPALRHPGPPDMLPRPVPHSSVVAWDAMNGTMVPLSVVTLADIALHLPESGQVRTHVSIRCSTQIEFFPTSDVVAATELMATNPRHLYPLDELRSKPLTSNGFRNPIGTL